jgi:hypothetical protein
MSNLHHNNEEEHFPCCCHRPEYAYTDTLCPMCEELAEMDRLTREADIQAFEDACSQMTPEDWDADNDWLESAGWGEM